MGWELLQTIANSFGEFSGTVVTFLGYLNSLASKGIAVRHEKSF